MRKILGFILVAVSPFIFSKSDAQVSNCSPLKFSGVAPSLWAIDAQIRDWETILGPVNSADPIFPFGATIGQNGSYDTYGQFDPDDPDPQNDLRVLSTIHDDYNLFFYFRRLTNSTGSSKAFYFFDTNIDGLVNSGEPVVGIYFNAQRVTKLAIYDYIPVNPNGDPIGEPIDSGNVCLVDGTSLPGTIEEIVNWHNATLLPFEVFSAAVTENGYGVELAIPWRFISEYKLIAYHLALQSGGGSYNPDRASDNASGCDARLDIIGDPDIEVENVSVSTIVAGLSFRIDVTFRNLTPAAIDVNVANFIAIKDIVQNDNLPIDEHQFSITRSGLPYGYLSGTFINQPIRFFGPGDLVIDPLSTKTFSLVISFPPNYSVKSAVVEFTPLSRFFLETECYPNTGGGGKPTNPIGAPVGDETTSKSNKATLNRGEIPNERHEKIVVYPNPSRGRTTLLLPDDDRTYDIQLTDYTGRLIRRWENVKPGRFEFETNKQGFYLLNIKSGNGLKYIKKLIVQ